MKNKTLYLTLLIVSSLVFASCAGAKYGCPATASGKAVSIEKNKV